MPLVLVPFCSQTAGATVVIDGITYRPPLVDVSGHLQVDVITMSYPRSPSTIVTSVTTVTTAGSPQRLDPISCKSIVIRAHETNAGVVYLGNVGVAPATAYRLSPGESVEMAAENANLFYVDAANDGDSVSYLTVN